MMRRALAGGVALVVLVTGSCSGTPPPTGAGEATSASSAGDAFDRTKPWPGPATPYHAVPMTDEDIEFYMEGVRKESAAVFRIEDPPTVEVVRFGTFEEAERDVRQCYIDAGFEVDDQGGTWAPKGGIDPDIDKAEALAYYTCRMQYPVHPKYFRTLTSEEAGILYDYTREWLIPCVHSMGYDPVGELPSREVYVQKLVDRQEPGNFSPYPARLSEEEDARLRRECPGRPAILEQ